MRFLYGLVFGMLVSFNLSASSFEADFKDWIQDYLASKGYTKEELRELKEDASMHFLFYKNDMKLGEPAPSLDIIDEDYVLDLKLKRKIRSLVLSNSSYDALESVKISISFPEDFEETTEKKYPLVFILPGFTNEKNAVKYIENPGDVIVVGYDFTFQNIELNDLFRMHLAKELIAVGAQVSASLNWLKEKPWVNKDKMNLLGVSFGGILLPMAQHYSEKQGSTVRASIIAFAGGDAKGLIERDLREKWGRREASMAASAFDFILTPFMPEEHLPSLNGSFLYVIGNEDSYFSEESVDEFYSYIPQPKQRLILSSGHINSDDTELIQRLVFESQRWLLKTGAL